MGGGDMGHGITYEHPTGDLDYAWRFPDVETFWLIIGSIFFVISFISFLPQTAELVMSRSSYGIEPLAIFCQSIGHFLLIVNLLCFKCFDFPGFIQYHGAQIFARALTFANLFFPWILLLPTIFQCFIYHDREYRESRKQHEIRIDWIKSVAQCALVVTVDLILLLTWTLLGVINGFETHGATSFGEICGTAATFLEFSEFVPQMYTTCRLRDAGSLSLLMLEIQAPADIANALYMWLGTGDHWTTWLTILVDGTEELILLGTCLVFNCMKARKAKLLEKERQMSMSLHASMEPEPILYERF